jgi:hypothetical protein
VREATPVRPDLRREFPTENEFSISNGFWKFAQGDFGGILMWDIFLNSSMILKDFRKIQYAMP